MDEPLRRALEKLNSNVRNYLTPVIAYSDSLASKAPETDRHKLLVITACAEKILGALEEFVAQVERSCESKSEPFGVNAPPANAATRETVKKGN